MKDSTYKMQETAKLFPKFLQFLKNFRDLTGNGVFLSQKGKYGLLERGRRRPQGVKEH